MNAPRVLLGGLAAALVLFVGRSLISTFLIADEMISLYEVPATDGEFAAALASGLAQGLAVAWLYAGVRPRLGPGPKTALLVGAAVWVLSSPHYLLVLGHVRMAGHMDHFPWKKYALFVAPASFAVMCCAALVGGILYREKLPMVTA